MRVLSIRQPYAEEILRGIKTIEYRSRPTRIINQRFYIYASRIAGDLKRFAKLNCTPSDLSTGVLVAAAKISNCTKGKAGKYEWHLTSVKRLKHPRKPKSMPQPVWFNPF